MKIRTAKMTEIKKPETHKQQQHSQDQDTGNDSNEKTDRLGEIFALQKGLADMMSPDRYPTKTDEKISALCTAIMHEAVELQRTTNWKWWKTPTEFNKTEAREELIDIWHFVIQASLELGLTPDDILAEYRRKNEINRNRQKSGY